ncbi:hypothetical protein ACFQGT_00115 [Natrialbaceae archaeon GCM10025810]
MAIADHGEQQVSTDEHSRPSIADLEPDRVLECRNDDLGITWYYGIEHGGIRLYHEWRDFEPRVRSARIARFVMAHPDVDVVERPRLEMLIERGER